MVSWPNSIRNLVIALERTFLSLGSSFCHFIVPHPRVIFQAHVGKAFPFPSSEDATEATATEARGCKVESSSSSLQAAAASPTQGRHYMLLSGKRDIVAASGSITSVTMSDVCSTHWSKKDSANFKRVAFYSIDNFVAFWLKWLQMISNDSKWLQIAY